MVVESLDELSLPSISRISFNQSGGGRVSVDDFHEPVRVSAPEFWELLNDFMSAGARIDFFRPVNKLIPVGSLTGGRAGSIFIDVSIFLAVVCSLGGLGTCGFAVALPELGEDGGEAKSGFKDDKALQMGGSLSTSFAAVDKIGRLEGLESLFIFRGVVV